MKVVFGNDASFLRKKSELIRRSIFVDPTSEEPGKPRVLL